MMELKHGRIIPVWPKNQKYENPMIGFQFASYGRYRHRLPPLPTIPDWRDRLAQLKMETAVSPGRPLPKLFITLAFALAALLMLGILRRSRSARS